eukprot:scaffold188744_cov30-Tisochrysis_lutea.AAC.1
MLAADQRNLASPAPRSGGVPPRRQPRCGKTFGAPDNDDAARDHPRAHHLSCEIYSQHHISKIEKRKAFFFYAYAFSSVFQQSFLM